MYLIGAILCIIVSYMSAMYMPVVFLIGFCVGYIVNAMYFGVMMRFETVEIEDEENDE